LKKIVSFRLISYKTLIKDILSRWEEAKTYQAGELETMA
jgi:hypothetical protein